MRRQNRHEEALTEFEADALARSHPGRFLDIQRAEIMQDLRRYQEAPRGIFNHGTCPRAAQSASAPTPITTLLYRLGRPGQEDLLARPITGFPKSRELMLDKARVPDTGQTALRKRMRSIVEIAGARSRRCDPPPPESGAAMLSLFGTPPAKPHAGLRCGFVTAWPVTWISATTPRRPRCLGGDPQKSTRRLYPA